MVMKKMPPKDTFIWNSIWISHSYEIHGSGRAIWGCENKTSLGGRRWRSVWNSCGALQSCFALESRSRHRHRGAYPPPAHSGLAPLTICMLIFIKIQVNSWNGKIRGLWFKKKKSQTVQIRGFYFKVSRNMKCLQSVVSPNAPPSFLTGWIYVPMSCIL